MRNILPALLTCVLLLLAMPAGGYEILLDIDTDDDPTTINDLTYDASAVVRIILAPTEPEEHIVSIDFGLGGSCLECNGVHQYGTGHDLVVDFEADWTELAELVGWADGLLLLDCPDDPGFHLILHAEPVIDYFVLTEPIFIATFNAWVADPVPPGCQQPASNLAAMFEQGENGFWNYVQLGGPAVGAEQQTWTGIKAGYR